MACTAAIAANCERTAGGLYLLASRPFAAIGVPPLIVTGLVLPRCSTSGCAAFFGHWLIVHDGSREVASSNLRRTYDGNMFSVVISRTKSKASEEVAGHSSSAHEGTLGTVLLSALRVCITCKLLCL